MSNSANPFVRVPPRLRGWILPILLLLGWWTVYHFEITQSTLFVAPEKVLETTAHMIREGELWDALSASLYRLLIGFSIGVSVGLIFGTALGMSHFFNATVGPTFHTLKQISLFAWIPMLSAWFGFGDAGKIAFLAMAAFFPVVINTYEGIRSVPRELIEVAQVNGFSRWQIIKGVVLPSAIPSLFTGLYLAMIYAWLATLGAEYLLSAGIGIGTLLVDGQEHLMMDQVMLGIIVVGLVGFLMNWSASTLEARLLRWRGTSTASN